MTEYILERDYDTKNGTFNTVKREEIVRCRDCRHYFESTIDEDGEGDPSFCFRWGEEWVRDDGFCAWGERRDA